MAELVKVETKKPAVESITVLLSKGEAEQLVFSYERYYGRSSVSRLLAEAAAGVAKPKPKTVADALAASYGFSSF